MNLTIAIYDEIRTNDDCLYNVRISPKRKRRKIYMKTRATIYTYIHTHQQKITQHHRRTPSDKQWVCAEAYRELPAHSLLTNEERRYTIYAYVYFNGELIYDWFNSAPPPHSPPAHANIACARLYRWCSPSDVYKRLVSLSSLALMLSSFWTKIHVHTACKYQIFFVKNNNNNNLVFLLVNSE